MRNVIQDKAQKFDEDDEDDYSDSDLSGSGSTSSLQDQLEAMDSVKIDVQIGSTDQTGVGHAQTFGQKAAQDYNNVSKI